MPSDATRRSPLDNARQATLSWVRSRMLDTIQRQMRRRLDHWRSADSTERPTPSDIDAIVRVAAAKNAGMSAGCTAVPGVLGAATIPAELVLNVRIATSMVVDIAVALDCASALDAELVAKLIFDEGRGIVKHLDADSLDAAASRNTARQVLGTAAGLVGRHSAKRLLRMVFGRIVPVVGAGGMALWTWRSTKRIADAARDVLSLPRTSEEQGMDVDALAEEVAEQVALHIADDVSSVETPSEPAELDESERLRRARHALLANGLRAISDPTAAQRTAFDDLFPESSFENAESALSRPDDLPLNLPLLASIDEQQLWTDIAAIVGEGNAPSMEWTEMVGSLFGLPADELEARVEALAA